MRKKKLQLHKKHGFLAMLTASAFLLTTVAAFEYRDVFADGDTTTASTENSTEKSTENLRMTAVRM